MRRYLLSSIALAAIIVAGCNPVGMDETRCFVRGYVYTDTSRTVPAEGIGIHTIGTQETYSAMTDQNGYYFIEIQMYPETQEDGGYGGITGAATFGLHAVWSNLEYFYGGSNEFEFTVFGGDTLTMYTIDLSMFKAAN